MTEINIDDVYVDDIENDPDPLDKDILDFILSNSNSKDLKDVPALKNSSQKVKKILKKYCSSGNYTLRANKVLEFYKCIDWLPYDKLDLTFLEKFSQEEKLIIQKEIMVYLNQKQDKLKRSKIWREDYKTRVWEYYKTNVPKYIKHELESLRDFELNLIGHDRNWQYYFSFNSFKKIDEFVNFPKLKRDNIYAEFKKDVYCYKNTRDHNLSEKFDNLGPPQDNWDDDIFSNETCNKCNSNKKESKPPTYNPDLNNDYLILGLNQGVSIDIIKKRYRKLAKLNHPDSPNGNEETMKKIVGAYDRLMKSLNTNV